MSKLKPYPKPVASRSGCKVSWNYYDDEETAKAASAAARHNARVLEEQGYEWGYQSPGSVHLDKATGRFEVTVV